MSVLYDALANEVVFREQRQSTIEYLAEPVVDSFVQFARNPRVMQQFLSARHRNEVMTEALVRRAAVSPVSL